MKDHDKNKESSNLQYWGVNNIHVNFGLQLYFTKGIQKVIIKRVIKDVSLKFMFKLHNDLHFLPKRMKIEKVKKLVATLHDKTKYVIDIRISKTSIKS